MKKMLLVCPDVHQDIRVAVLLRQSMRRRPHCGRAKQMRILPSARQSSKPTPQGSCFAAAPSRHAAMPSIKDLWKGYASYSPAPSSI